MKYRDNLKVHNYWSEYFREYNNTHAATKLNNKSGKSKNTRSKCRIASKGIK